jgi:Tfp pilus assembly protein PilN
MSMITVNLLPDVRIKRLKVQHQRRLALSSMILVVVVCSAVLLIGFLIVSAQNLQINNLTKNIADRQQEFVSIPDVKTILVTQQNLASLGTLYKSRVRLSAFFDVIQAISPQDVSIRSLALGEGNAITITGGAKDYLTASKLAKAMESSGVDINKGSNISGTPDFTNVQLSGLAADQSGRVSFSISAVASARVINGN